MADPDASKNDNEIQKNRDLLLQALPRPSPALSWRRLRHEIMHKWTPATLRGFRALHRQADGGLEVDFAAAGQRLRVVFSIHYPFRALRLFVMSRRVPHAPHVARALHARLPPPELRARVARCLAEPCSVPFKEWIYLRHARGASSPTTGAAAARRCTQALPPHHWSPAMDLAQLWDAIVSMLAAAARGGGSADFF